MITRRDISVAIIGGGIGGLAAALSLLRDGLDVHVYEQARALGEVGAGIQISPNASRILHRLGLADALAAYEGWHPQVRGILGAVDETFKWALLDRKPMARWSCGRMALLGDACHAMLPFMAQGAAQAIEDGATLAACLSPVAARDVPEALRRYEGLRLPRASRVQALSEINKTRFHLPDGPAQQQRDAEMARGLTDWSLEAVAWLYGYDAGGTLTPADRTIDAGSDEVRLRREGPGEGPDASVGPPS